MAGVIRYVLRRPRVMDSRLFLWLMATFPAVISKKYDAKVVRDGDGIRYTAPLAAGLKRVPGKPARILDLCTGTGIAAFAAAEAFPDALVEGVDQSSAMINIAAGKALAAGVSNVRFVVGNARRLDYRDGEFDLIVTSNAPVYLDELVRVLKYGGSVLAAYAFAGDAFVQAKSDLAVYLARSGLRLVEIAVTNGGGAYIVAAKPT